LRRRRALPGLAPSSRWDRLLQMLDWLNRRWRRNRPAADREGEMLAERPTSI